MYKQIFSILAVLVGTLVAPTLCHAQNMMHYATSPDGVMDYVLFPSKDGSVFVNETIACPANADDIKDVTEAFMIYMNGSSGIKVKPTGVARKLQSYNVKMEFAEAPLTFEVFGSPVACINRSASEVKFKVIIAQKDSLCTVTMTDFETNRTTLRGAAKNDGDPNVIHWQRVNSLRKERDAAAQNFKPDSREARSINYDYDRQIEFENYLYANEANGVNCILDGLHKALSKENFGEINFERKIVAPHGYKQVVDNVKPYDKATFHGNLLAPGNNVYIVGGNTMYENSGADELRKQIILDGLWNVTDNIDKAHFVIQYTVETEGRDRAFITITDNEGGRVVSQFRGSETDGSESISENKEFAEKIYRKGLQRLVKDINNNKTPKEFLQYIIP